MKLIFSYIFTVSFLFSQSCPPENLIPITPLQNEWNIPSQNGYSTLEVMTWNLKQFPLSGDETIENVQEIISDLKVDLIAFQEINSYAAYQTLQNLLPAYEFIITNYWGDFSLNLAYAYRTDFLNLNNSTTLFSSEGYNFAYRYPFMASFSWQCGNSSLNFSAINIHLKAYGDSESFQRRYESCQIISDYINAQINIGNDKIIVLGDFNDETNESQNNNSLWPLVVNSNSQFITNQINGDNYFNSYILGSSSLIDHILITTGFNDYLINDLVTTIRVDDYVGYNYYTNNISDHRPVLWKIYINEGEFSSDLIINEIMSNPSAVSDEYGEWFEIFNNSAYQINLDNYIIRDNDDDFHIINQANLIIQPNDFLLLGRNSNNSLNGGINVDYEYSDFLLGNSFDEVIITSPNGIIIDEVWYDNGNSFPDPVGKSMSLNDYLLDNSNGSNWSESTNQLFSGDYSTPGEENFGCIEITWYADFDNDGLGDPEFSILSCDQPEQFVENNLDLDPNCSSNDTDICGVCGGMGVDGDVNNDNFTNIVDVVQLVSHILGNSNLEELGICKGDLNSDNMINIVDVVLIVNLILADS